MSPFVKKEIRLLLPGFLTSIVLAFSNCLLPDFGISEPIRDVLVVFPFLCCPAMVVMMALNSFGSELSFGTFSNLLAQPIARKEVWRVKIFLLAGALVIVGSLWCVFFYLRYAAFENPNNPQDFRDILIFVGTFLLVVFSGALWTVLLIRQVAAAFWFTVLTPAMILVLTAGIYEVLPQSLATLITLTLLGFYSVAGYCLARRLFLRAQDTQWTGGTIALPEMRGLSRWLGNKSAIRRWRPRVALWRKELQLHQSQLIIAGVLAVLHTIVVVTRKCFSFQRNSATELILESFCGLWLVMPLLIGCAAMAEERKMATLESQLCQPVKRRTQFFVKVLAVFILAVLLGTVMPWLFEGGRILPDFPREILANPDVLIDRGPLSTTRLGSVWLWVLQLLYVLAPAAPFLFVAAINAGLAGIAFYGSSLSRNTLQGLAPSVLGLLLLWFVSFVALSPEDFGLGFLWRGPLFFLIAIPVMTLVVAVLAYYNCQRIRITWGAWFKNLLTLGVALALVTATTSAVYYRSWELLSLTEPPHGLPLWSTANAPRLQITYQTITVYLPDGRVWMDRYGLDQSSPGMKIVEDRAFGGGRFLEGTNWTGVVDSWRGDIVGIQRDGSLWVSKIPDQRYYAGLNLVSEAAKLERFGDKNDWREVSGRFFYSFLLKNDGTLWCWGTNHWDSRRKWPGLKAFVPQQLGTNSDWQKIFNANDRTFLIKTNGEVWSEPPHPNSDQTMKFSPGSITIGRAPHLEARQWKDLSTINALPLSWTVIINDGTFRQIASYKWTSTPKKFSKITGPHPANHGSFTFVQTDKQIGQETNWVEMAACNEFVVTLKADGTLWKWNFIPLSFRSRADFMVRPPNLTRMEPSILSAHSDWVAIGEMMGGVVSLAADGSLYLWRFDAPTDYRRDLDAPLLQVSRRPVLLGNVFSQTN